MSCHLPRRAHALPALLLLLFACSPGWSPAASHAAGIMATIPVGVLPAGIALNPATGLVYVANGGDGTLSIIAAASNSVVATLSFAETLTLGGSAAPVGVALNPTTNTVYVAESGAAQVALVDGATSTRRATIPVAPGPWGIAVNVTTNTVYVSSLAGSVSVLDGTSGAVKTVITDSRLQRPVGIAVNEKTNQVYVANLDGNSVAVIDGATNTISANVPVGSKPAAVAVDPVSGMVYTANSGAATLSKIDPTTNTVTATLTVGAGPVAVAVDPATEVVYVAATDNSITELDRTGQSLGMLTDPALSGLQAIGVNVAGGVAYVTSGTSGAVVLIPLVQVAPVAQ